jgi:transcriptional regulator with XRE-family HTH domain
MIREDFAAWHTRMGFKSQTEGAERLGVKRSTYANYMSGTSRTTGNPVDYTLSLALACAAVEAGIKPLGHKD